MKRLGMSNDFTFDFGSLAGSSPAGLTGRLPDLPGPFARAPLQSLRRYCGPVPPLCLASVLRPSRILPVAVLPLRPGADFTHFDWPSVLRRQVLLFRTSACDELTPPLHRAPPGDMQAAYWLRATPSRRVPLSRVKPAPGFDAVFFSSMRQQWFTHVRLLVAHLTR